ncbi:MAG: methyltransferase [Alphaproteobacteria bacterium]|nr:methyltransferase [Alphaproteobacteria bacterium]
MTFDPIDFIRTQTQILPPSIIPEIRLHLATEVTPLWTLTEERLRHADLPPPFWAFAWPGGQGVARYVLDHPELVKGKRVLDFAAGSGVGAIAAMKAGAKSALAVDIDTLALIAIRLNAEINQVGVKTSEGIDLTKAFAKADVIIAGDVCYQQAMSAKLIRWLRYCVEDGALVLLADPGRAYVPQEGMVKLASYDVPTSRDLEDRDMRTVTVWRMERVVEEEA